GEALSIEREDSSWRVRVGGDWISARDVVLACPAYVSGSIVGTVAPELGREVSSIPYSSAILLTLIFQRAELNHLVSGFGFLTPPSERKTLAAATYIHTKFPSRVGEGLAALRGFVVGNQAETLMNAPDSDLLRLVREDFKRLLKIEAQPVTYAIHRWPKSMPQYVVGHAERYRRICQHLQGLPGLYVISNAYEGVGIPDCVRLAKETANSLASRSF
ncbi:MAG: FAD-dependent oxidoreductase, partial [Bryobacteraceae bacterium]